MGHGGKQCPRVLSPRAPGSGRPRYQGSIIAFYFIYFNPFLYSAVGGWGVLTCHPPRPVKDFFYQGAQCLHIKQLFSFLVIKDYSKQFPDFGVTLSLRLGLVLTKLLKFPTVSKSPPPKKHRWTHWVMCPGGRSHLGVVHISRLRAVHMVSFCFPQGSALVRLHWHAWYAPQLIYSPFYSVVVAVICRWDPTGPASNYDI